MSSGGGECSVLSPPLLLRLRCYHGGVGGWVGAKRWWSGILAGLVSVDWVMLNRDLSTAPSFEGLMEAGGCYRGNIEVEIWGC